MANIYNQLATRQTLSYPGNYQTHEFENNHYDFLQFISFQRNFLKISFQKNLDLEPMTFSNFSSCLVSPKVRLFASDLVFEIY